ncbi:hypothetical protein HK100_002679 [Physocladia obscura]|uniref:tRNA (guanine(26)-N(2))-dimethyltransferase n=1 Tax=Physocladia obscura TaxID=109957 RepID=A0AAD5T809_9FUNG|nr:hypothetical protein HK100_002679 [Physocladia obscura]
MGSYETSGKSVKFKNPSFPKDLGSTCQICDSKFHVGGPFYSGRIHNPDFVSKMIAYVKETCPPAEGVDKKFGTHVRMLGMLTVISEELHDIALFYGLDAICQALHCVVPQMKVFFSAVVNAGYKISGSHCNPTAFKTDAPNSVVWDILRSWIKKNPVSQKRLVAGAVATKILAKEPILAANFTFNQSAIPKSKKSDGKNETGDAKKAHVVRFAPNPTKNWGPKSKAKPNSGQLKPFSGKDTAIIGEKRHREDE